MSDRVAYGVISFGRADFALLFSLAHSGNEMHILFYWPFYYFGESSCELDSSTTNTIVHTGIYYTMVRSPPTIATFAVTYRWRSIHVNYFYRNAWILHDGEAILSKRVKSRAAPVGLLMASRNNPDFAWDWLLSTQKLLDRPSFGMLRQCWVTQPRKFHASHNAELFLLSKDFPVVFCPTEFPPYVLGWTIFSNHICKSSLMEILVCQFHLINKGLDTLSRQTQLATCLP
ncbi:hypothetical protein F5B18DRAFT_296737 [Nemania serpens]|nr:hypothetical protein F5B18DRAFT_296737 [Nemania serpens]